jgi:hypothetical protein
MPRSRNVEVSLMRHIDDLLNLFSPDNSSRKVIGILPNRSSRMLTSKPKYLAWSVDHKTNAAEVIGGVI